MSDNLGYDPNLPVSRANPVVDLDKAMELRLKGLTYHDIARYFGVTTSTVSERLQGLIPEGSDVKAFRKYRGDILDGKQESLLKSLSEDDIKAASPYQKVGMFGILYDKSRLEHDKSVTNISYLDHTQEYNEANKRRQELLDQLGLDDDADLDSL